MLWLTWMMNLSGILRTLSPLSQHPPWLRVSPSVLCLHHQRFVSSHRPRDLYNVLGVKTTAEQKEIKDSFYKLSKEHHPDVNKKEGAQKRFREILEAYEILGSPDKRKEYDIQMGIRWVISNRHQAIYKCFLLLQTCQLSSWWRHESVLRLPGHSRLPQGAEVCRHEGGVQERLLLWRRWAQGAEKHPVRPRPGEDGEDLGES